MFAVLMIVATVALCLTSSHLNEKHEKETGEKTIPFI
jgi:hypothetical protein